MEKYQLILASGSPRRKELLGYLDVSFLITPSDIEEISSFSDPSEVAKDLARQKGNDVFSKTVVENPLIVSSDTLVECDGVIYGKPKDRSEAKRILSELSAKTHRVHTGVFLKSKDKEECFVVSTEVKFAPITEDLLETYLNTNESLDKAGAYGIQGPGLTFIETVNGSYSNVVGFPLYEFIISLKKFIGISDNWREAFV